MYMCHAICALWGVAWCYACSLGLCMTEQGCALNRKFLNYDALLCVESGICFRVLSVLCRMCACCGWVFICCRVFLDALGLVYVQCADSS